MTSSWPGTLDAFQRHIELQAALVEEGRYDEVVAFVPPPDLPPLPKSLTSRATELLDRAQTLSDKGDVLRGETLKRMGQSRHQRFDRRTAPAFIDAQA